MAMEREAAAKAAGEEAVGGMAVAGVAGGATLGGKQKQRTDQSRRRHWAAPAHPRGGSFLRLRKSLEE